MSRRCPAYAVGGLQIEHYPRSPSSLAEFQDWWQPRAETLILRSASKGRLSSLQPPASIGLNDLRLSQLPEHAFHLGLRVQIPSAPRRGYAILQHPLGFIDTFSPYQCL